MFTAGPTPAPRQNSRTPTLDRRAHLNRIQQSNGAEATSLRRRFFVGD